jgi:hypothetical protein
MAGRPYRFAMLLPVLLALGMLLSACSKDVTTSPFPVSRQLPGREEARYTLTDSKGAGVGAATLTIATEGDGLRLGVAYDFGPTQQDTSGVSVRRDSMRPARSDRTVVDGDKRYVTRAEYAGEKVTAIFNDGGRDQTREAKISDSAYDNLESLFLWRTIDMSVGREARYTNVVVDPKHGTISRALATVRVEAREEVRLPSGPVQAWRVSFTSAGTTNTAWYRDDDTRELVRYEITRGPTLVLDSVSP